MSILPGDDVPETVATFINRHGPAGLTAALTRLAEDLSKEHHARPDDPCPTCGNTAPCEVGAWAWTWLMDHRARVR